MTSGLPSTVYLTPCESSIRSDFCRFEQFFSPYLFSSQAEIVKRLNGICAQVLPYLSQEVMTLKCPRIRSTSTCSTWEAMRGSILITGKSEVTYFSETVALFSAYRRFPAALLHLEPSSCWPRVVFVSASTASHGCHRESQAGHAPWDELHHKGELYCVWRGAAFLLAS